ncbi:GlcG/HbpS family heme-binding protein, partial [Burkholderia gladioli]|uniref:GlcG/HbpS family heme-binding protein n=1 Tax=Burkholderia gladioli TaxID=28095 RepID=UPI002B256498
MLPLDHANALIAAATHHAREHGLPPVSVTVVDATAYPVAFARRDDCVLGAIDVAYRKARTAAL